MDKLDRHKIEEINLKTYAEEEGFKLHVVINGLITLLWRKRKVNLIIMF